MTTQSKKICDFLGYQNIKKTDKNTIFTQFAIWEINKYAIKKKQIDFHKQAPASKVCDEYS